MPCCPCHTPPRRVLKSVREDWEWGLGVRDDFEREMVRAWDTFVAGVRSSLDGASLPPEALEQLAGTLQARWEEVAQDVIVRVGVRELGRFGALKDPKKLILENPYVDGWLAEHGAELVTEVGDEVKAVLKEVLRQGHKEGVPVPELGRRIRPVVGLHSRQLRAVQALHEALVEQGVGGKRLEDRLASYAKRLHRQRALLIARTETMFALNAGTDAAWAVATEEGLLPKGTERKWVAGVTTRTCTRCEGLYGEKAPLGQRFKSRTDGTTHERPPAHPACRCRMVLVIPGWDEA